MQKKKKGELFTPSTQQLQVYLVMQHKRKYVRWALEKVKGQNVDSPSRLEAAKGGELEHL